MYSSLSQIWGNIQGVLFPELEESIGPLTKQHKKLISILELVRIEKIVQQLPPAWFGRKPTDRSFLARAFIAKIIYKLPYTNQLRDYLICDKHLRTICGWSSKYDIPSESKFSRVFAEFAKSKLAEEAHAELIKYIYRNEIVGHVCKDSTPIEARSRAVIPTEEEKNAKKKKKNEKPTRIERQASGEMPLQDMLEELPKDCTFGKKKKANGKTVVWKGYKLHLAVDDHCIPLSAIVTAASLNDNQVAIPLAIQTDKVVTNFYDLMDSAYDVPGILEHSRSLGHVPIVDKMSFNIKQKEEKAAELKRRKLLGRKPAEAKRYKERMKSERANATSKDFYGVTNIWYRGYEKVSSQIMFGILTLSASLLLSLFDTT